jgi:hypothetical protein
MSLEAERLAFLEQGRLAADGIPYGDLLRLDRLVPAEDMAALERAGSPSVETVVHEDGGHCCHNIASVVRPQMADWLSSRLGATRPLEARAAGAR